MSDKNPHDDSPEYGAAPSKSALKRQMTALQVLGESLIDLSDKQLQGIPDLDEELLIAIREAQNIRTHSARRRHLQLIGKLMRYIDPQPIESALRTLHKEKHQVNDIFHELEELRDRLLEHDNVVIEDVLNRWPNADRQQLRQLALQHKREVSRGKTPAASRKLFKYLRELYEASTDSD